MPLGPYDLNGPQFLTLYAFLLGASVIAGFLIPYFLRPAGRSQRVTDVDQLAFLAGGRRRFRESVVAGLLASRRLVMTGRNRFKPIPGERTGSGMGARILALPSPISWRQIEIVLAAPIASLVRRLAAAGLVMDREELTKTRLLATLPYLLLFLFGAGKWAVGMARDRPIVDLTALLVATALFAGLRWFRMDPRTRAGREVVSEERRKADRLRRAPTNPEVGMAVALFGTAVLAGSGWEGFHKARAATPGGGGGCSGGGGGTCGDGGGCGGGCGGCGGS
jgi:uncharacterized protein (TIGR04222 family)